MHRTTIDTMSASKKTSEEQDSMRSALQAAVAQICAEECQNEDSSQMMTKSAVQTLTELTYLYATTSLADDLVAFSQHANRRTITPDDVILVGRKNPDNLLSKLKNFASTLGATTTGAATSTSTKTTKPPSKRKEKKQSPRQKGSPKRSAETRFDRMLRQMDSDSELSSDDNVVEPQKTTSKQQPALEPVVDSDEDSLDELERKSSAKAAAKRKYQFNNADEEDSDDDDPPISQFRRKKKASIDPPRRRIQKLMGGTSNALSSDDDSIDF